MCCRPGRGAAGRGAHRLHALDELVDRGELAVGPALNVAVPAELFEHGDAHAERGGGVVDGLVEHALQLLERVVARELLGRGRVGGLRGGAVHAARMHARRAAGRGAVAAARAVAVRVEHVRRRHGRGAVQVRGGVGVGARAPAVPEAVVLCVAVVRLLHARTLLASVGA